MFINIILRQCLTVVILATPVLNINAQTIYVSQNNPNASDSSNGSIETPFLTLSKAASTLLPGDTLIINDGIYRESIILPAREWMSNSSTIIKSNNPDTVIIKGSDIVNDWQDMGNNLYRKTNWLINTQQVFIDGQPLQQIGGTVFDGYPLKSDHKAHSYLENSSIWPGRIDPDKNGLTINSFYYDQNNQVLYIKINNVKSINNHVIEASTRPYLVHGNQIHKLVINGLHFKHANTSDKSRAGAITLRGSNISLNNIHISEVDSVGLNLSGNDNSVTNSLMNYCGQLGMKVRGKNNYLDNNETNYNNTRGFSKWWEAGGAKFVGEYGLHNSKISNHKSFFNQGDGIWLDWGNSKVEITNSISAYNNGFGIHYEASFAGNINNNIVFANSQRGIYLAHSSDSLIYNNLVALNKMEGIVVIDESRRDKKGILDLIPKNNKIIGNIVAWNSQNHRSLILPALNLNNTSDYNLYITENNEPSFSIGWPKSMLKIFNNKSFDLKHWKINTSQDVNSWSINLPKIAEITKAIHNRSIEINWTQLLNIAKQYKIDDKELQKLQIEHQISLSQFYPGPKDMQ